MCEPKPPLTTSKEHPPGCQLPIHSKTMCRKHYDEKRRVKPAGPQLQLQLVKEKVL